MPNPRLPSPTDPSIIDRVLTELLASFTAAAATNLGFPAATDLDFTALAPFLNYMINNLGDARADGDYPIHVKALEREAVNIIADLLRAPLLDRWGYVTSGASEGTEQGLWLARTRWPDAIVYYSTAAHHSVAQTIERLRMPSIAVRAGAGGEMDYDDLATQIDQHRDRPVVVVAGIGTPITEAIDDTRRITTVLDAAAITRRWIHADAALSGISLAVWDTPTRPGFDFADGVDSMIVSGHKMLGSPIPYGVFLVRDHLRPDAGRLATYTGAPNSTVSNSRAGLAVLILWYTLRTRGHALAERAQRCRDLAAYTCDQLNHIGVGAWRHPHAVTVVLPPLPAPITHDWVLAHHGEHNHLICMPGITRNQIDAFVTAVAALMPATTSRRRGRIPRQRAAPVTAS